MSITDGFAALLFFTMVILGGRTRFAAPGNQDTEKTRVTNRRCSLVTDCIVCLWASGGFYCICLILKPPIEPVATQFAATIAPLLAAFAALERWRWSRKALIGMGSLVLFDAGLAIVRYHADRALPLGSLFSNAAVWKSVLSGYTGSPVFGASTVALAAVTVPWMMRADVRAQFDHRKRTRTRRWQIGIATVLVSVYWMGLSGVGLARSIRPQCSVTAVITATPPTKVASAIRPASQQAGRR